MLSIILFIIFIIPFLILCNYVAYIRTNVREIRDMLKNKTQ